MGVTYFRCPHCRTHLNMRGGLRNKLYDIGEPTVTCPNCGGQIRTGGNEWVNLTLLDKAKIWGEVYVYYGLIIAPGLGFAVGGSLNGIFGVSPIPSWAAGIAIWCLVMLRVHFVHRGEVKESLARKPND